MESSSPQAPPKGLSSAKREDIWALFIALMLFVISLAAPQAVHDFFKDVLYIF